MAKIPLFRTIKGGGAALTREKIIAAAADMFVCIVDSSKTKDRLGGFPLAVEVVPFARTYVAGVLRQRLGAEPRLREGVTELYCHPSFLPCREVQYWTPTYRRAVELAALTSPAVRVAVANLHIELVSYLDCRSAGD